MEECREMGPALNWQQVVRELACSKSYFYKLVDAGEFPNSFRLGAKGIREPKADVEAFKERNRVA